MSAVIELAGLSVELGRREILKQLTGSLSGRAIGLLGPNGAGKTTLLHTLLGFYPASGGTARVLGHDIKNDSRMVRELIGYMPENDSFIAGMSAVRFVRMMAEVSGLPPEAALERTHECLYYVGLGEARYRNLDTYSLGMKQLAKLAQALVGSPKLLLLDEPTNGLDPPARARMLRLIGEIRDSGKVQIVLSSHLLHDVERTCDSVLILKNGRIAAMTDLAAERRTNRSFVELETHGDTTDFVAAALKLGCECAEGRKGGLKLVVPADMGSRELMRLAHDHGVEVRRFAFKRDTLEEIFLKAMEESPDGRL